MLNSLSYECSSPQSQLNLVKLLNEEHSWGLSLSDFPTRIPSSDGLKPNEQLLLAVFLPGEGNIKPVQRTFDKLWEAIQAPVGFKKEKLSGFRSDSLQLRLAPGIHHKPGAHWVAVNLIEGYEREIGSDGNVGPKTKLASAEMFMVAIQCPQLLLRKKNNMALVLGGYEIRDCSSCKWVRTPVLFVKDKTIHLSIYDVIESHIEHMFSLEVATC